ncbi:hypothetical protein A3Q56_02002 [Intoshia linei]|uniref:Small RNA 2'-O-methyltransferase n=1 Tax=Intoshia linei TaxID=1819745 RepID=A0A177B7F1_9BILA|nr:hypothetical protein A3Q56_02002 [Intoshia linei]
MYDKVAFQSPFKKPVYIQRYELVSNNLKYMNASSVLDVGCSDMKFFQYLKNTKTIHRIGMLDLDEKTMYESDEPKRCYNEAFKNRPHFIVECMLADIFNVKKNTDLAKFDAVSMIEFVEHIHEDKLNDLIKIIFEYMSPRIVIITTPNSDYNHLLEMKNKFRHDDHKFEWTQNEFQTWCTEISSKYQYKLDFEGVGKLITDTDERVGFCSQVAIFESLTIPRKENDSFEIKFDEHLKLFRNVNLKCENSEEYLESSSDEDLEEELYFENLSLDITPMSIEEINTDKNSLSIDDWC